VVVVMAAAAAVAVLLPLLRRLHMSACVRWIWC